MSINMSYCRFENTYKALLECDYSEGIEFPEELSESERSYRNKLVRLCKRIADELDEEES